MTPLRLELLYEALATPFGIELSVTDVERARQRLYTLRREAADPDLDTLSIVIPPGREGVLWLIRRTPLNGQS